LFSTDDQYASSAAFIGAWLPATLAVILCTPDLAKRAPGTGMVAPPIESRPGRHQRRWLAASSPGKAAHDDYVAVGNRDPPDGGGPGGVRGRTKF
jgi:hypothetical protein